MKNIKKFLTALIACVIFCFFLSSCSYIDIDSMTLLSPPKAAGEMNDIQQALIKYAGYNITLKYPQHGNNKTAFVLHDIDGDKTDEAFAFYTSTIDGAAAPLHVNLIRKIEGEWKSTDDITLNVASVDRIDFTDFDKNGSKEIIIGFSTISATEYQLNIYSMENNKLKQRNQSSYSDFIICESEDGTYNQLFIVNLKSSERKAEASLITYKDKAISVLGSTATDGGVTSYAKIQTGKTVDGKQAFFIDAYKGSSSVITEIVYMKNGNLVNPLYDTKAGETYLTLRESSDICRDINGDGLLDIPVLEVMPGYASKTSDEKMYLTTWKNFNCTDVIFSTVYMSDSNYKDGYTFEFESNWLGNVTVEKDTANRIRIYKIWDVTTQKATDEILRIRVYSDSEYSGVDKTGLIELGRADSIVYVAKIMKTDSEFSIDDKTVRENFSLIGQGDKK